PRFCVGRWGITWPLLLTTCQRNVNLSWMPGSVKLPAKETGEPSATVRFAPSDTVGATFCTVTLVPAEPLAPSESVTVTPIAYEPVSVYVWFNGPNDVTPTPRLSVLLEPSLQAMTTVWVCPGSGSLNVPLSASDPPSLIALLVRLRLPLLMAGG